MLFEKEEEIDRVGRLAALGAYNPPLGVTLHLAFFSLIFSGPDRSTCPLGCFLYLCLTMAYVDMESIQFYQPPTKAGVRSDGRPTPSNLRVTSPHREGKTPVALEASQESNRVLHNPDLIQSQNVTGPLQKDFLDSFRAPGLSLNDTKANREIANMPSERDNTSWDDMIPLSCQRASDRPHRPRFRYPPGTICKSGVLGKPTAGKTAWD